MARIPGGETAIRARIGAAPGLSIEDGHRLAGLLEAECHLYVVPNNKDGWRCGCQVNLRDDDRELLEKFHSGLGLGRLVQVPARRGSRPQINWGIESKVECSALVDLLDAHPLRGRKRKEYEIWREAVKEWAVRRYGLAPGGHPRLQRLVTALRKAREYRAPEPDADPPALSDPYARHYFAGFFSGEGCFLLRERDARFVIKLRRDDRPLLEAFRDGFGLGKVRNVATPEPWSPAATWNVVGARDVLKGIALFRSAGLLGRKKRQFEAWQPGAQAVATAKMERAPLDRQIVESARGNLARVTAYTPPAVQLRLDPGYGDARTAYINVLRSWAALADGPLSCVAYQTARRLQPHWPKRDTIAFAFGGWYEALRSAGLESRAARRPSTR